MRRQRAKSDAGESFSGTGSRRKSETIERYRSGWVRDPHVVDPSHFQLPALPRARGTAARECSDDEPESALSARDTPSTGRRASFARELEQRKVLEFSPSDVSPVPYLDYDDVGERSTAADEGDARSGGALSDDDDLPLFVVAPETPVKDAEQETHLLRVDDFCRAVAAEAAAAPTTPTATRAPAVSRAASESAFSAFWYAIWGGPRAEGPVSRMTPGFYGSPPTSAGRWGSDGWPEARDISEIRYGSFDEARCSAGFAALGTGTHTSMQPDLGCGSINGRNHDLNIATMI